MQHSCVPFCLTQPPIQTKNWHENLTVHLKQRNCHTQCRLERQSVLWCMFGPSRFQSNRYAGRSSTRFFPRNVRAHRVRQNGGRFVSVSDKTVSARNTREGHDGPTHRFHKSQDGSKTQQMTATHRKTNHTSTSNRHFRLVAATPIGCTTPCRVTGNRPFRSATTCNMHSEANVLCGHHRSTAQRLSPARGRVERTCASLHLAVHTDIPPSLPCINTFHNHSDFFKELPIIPIHTCFPLSPLLTLPYICHPCT